MGSKGNGNKNKKKTLDQAAPVVGEMQVPWKCGVQGLRIMQMFISFAIAGKQVASEVGLR
jgi:hypothetical protein